MTDLQRIVDQAEMLDRAAHYRRVAAKAQLAESHAITAEKYKLLEVAALNGKIIEDQEHDKARRLLQ